MLVETVKHISEGSMTGIESAIDKAMRFEPITHSWSLSLY
jgi:hypothetical protein